MSAARNLGLPGEPPPRGHRPRSNGLLESTFEDRLTSVAGQLRRRRTIVGASDLPCYYEGDEIEGDEAEDAEDAEDATA